MNKINRLSCLTLLLAVLLASCVLRPPVVWSANYYVAPPPSGDASNPCAPDSPTTRRATIGGGIACLSPGDTLIVGDGTYTECTYDQIPQGLSASQPTTIRAENKRKAIMTGNPTSCGGAYIATGTRGDKFGPGNPKHYMTIDGLKFDIPLNVSAQPLKFFGGTEPDTTTGPCLFDGPHDIQLLNNEMTGGYNVGNTDEFVVGIGFGFPDHHWTVRGNYIHDIGMANANSLQVGWSYGMYLSGGFSTFENNEVSRTSGFGIHGYSNHRCFNNNIFRNNYIHDTGGAVLLACGGQDNKIYNNVIARTGLGPATPANAGGLRFGPTCGGASIASNEVYHNTIVRAKSEGYGCLNLSYAAGVDAFTNTVRNNLCWLNATPTDALVNNSGAAVTNVMDHNLCAGVTGTGSCGGVTYADPLFVKFIPDSDLDAAGIKVEDFKLQSGSLARNAGTSVGITTDYGGNSRDNSQPSLGAWEFGGSVAPPLPPEVLRWRMNEASGGTTQDATNNGYTGTLVGPPARGPGREGPKSLTFDGTSTYVQNTALAWPPNIPMTMAVWVNAPSLTALAGSVGVGGQERPNRFGLHLPWGQDGMLKCDYGNDLAGGHIETPMSPYIGKWVHVACTSNGMGGGSGRMVLYINGQAVVTTSQATAPQVQLTGVTVGRTFFPPSATYYHTGGLDDFRLYSIELNAAQVLQLYREDAGIHRHNPLALR